MYLVLIHRLIFVLYKFSFVFSMFLWYLIYLFKKVDSRPEVHPYLLHDGGPANEEAEGLRSGGLTTIVLRKKHVGERTFAEGSAAFQKGYSVQCHLSHSCAA